MTSAVPTIFDNGPTALRLSLSITWSLGTTSWNGASRGRMTTMSAPLGTSASSGSRLRYRVGSIRKKDCDFLVGSDADVYRPLHTERYLAGTQRPWRLLRSRT